ncbi:glycosyltransferase family 2 protein [Geomonas silvestris]|uniref:glycosyltransferase family 2 protein n=1 Tax=Geomonas silvestris TaxID=2740184 RepID=UPI0016229A3B|nr:glycosyltransferase family A protein [Geomonas silvestris]
MTAERITVVIPLYNKADYIARALRSVLEQRCPPFEVIVVDDGSTDRGPQVVLEFQDARVKLVRQPNGGVSAARNRGIQEAAGELIAFLDADDAWYPHFLQTVLRLRKSFPDAGLYATGYEIVSAGKRRPLRLHGIPLPPWEGEVESYFLSAALGEAPVCSSAVCIPKKVFSEIGCFLAGRRMGEDVDLWGRIAANFPLAYSPLAAACYHHDATNRACTRFESGDEHPFICSAELFLTSSGTRADQHHLRLYIRRLKLENARQHVIAGNLARGRELLAGKVAAPFFVRHLLWGTRFNGFTRLLFLMKSNVLRFLGK